MENSIKESIERLKLCSTNQCHICGRYEKEECMLERNRCEQHILSEYKRVLKENEELRIKNNAIKKESEVYAENLIRLDNELNQENKKCMILAIEKQDYFEKYRYHLQQNESLTKEFSNVIPIQKIKDKIKEIGEKIKYEENEKVVIYLHKQKNILQELLESEE